MNSPYGILRCAPDHAAYRGGSLPLAGKPARRHTAPPAGLLVVVAEAPDVVHVVSPIFLDLDPGLEVDLRAHEALDVLPRLLLLGRDCME